MNASELFDRGAQPERTLLAWSRTCLALAVVVAVVVKVLAGDADATLVVLTACGLALPVLAWVLAVVRYRHMHRRLTGAALPAGGAAMAVATAATVLTGVLALLLVVR